MEGTMNNNTYYKNQLEELKGKTIAIVYIFEGEDAPGFNHYWVWKSDIISGWLNAVQELECVPFILDVRTFVQKAMNHTLPHIDFVVNLNCGSYDLSSMSLVPSTCSFLSIPCIPCNAAAIILSENKKVSNLLAIADGLPLPPALDAPSENGIYRPLNLGNSIGVKKGICEDITRDGTYQEFIPGYDITIPMVYNPLLDELDLLPPLLYLPDSRNPNWIYDETEKEKDYRAYMLPISKIDNSTKQALIHFAHIFPIQTFGRIDARIKCNEARLSEAILQQPLSLNNFYFIEMNSMPTIEKEDSFETAFQTAYEDENHSMHLCIKIYKESIKTPSLNGFLLSCSMIAFSKAKFQNQKDYIHTAK